MKDTKQRNKIFLLSIIVIIAIMVVANWGTLISVTPSDYGTGINVDTSSKRTIISGHNGAIVDYDYITVKNNLNHNDPGEIFDSDRYIVAWQPGTQHYSTTLTAKVDFSWRVKYEKLWSIYYLFSDYPQTIIKQNYWWDVLYTDTSGKTIRIIDGKNFTGGANDISVNKDYVFIQRGYPKRWFPGLTDCSWAITSGGQWYSKASSGTHILETETLAFKMKGNRPGVITIRCYLEDSAYSLRDEGLPGATTRKLKLTGPVLLSEDKAYLADGVGNLEIDSLNAIGNAGQDTAEGTDAVYSKYVWAEGQTVTFRVNTGYSGTSLEPHQEGYKEGWHLQISNPNGKVIKTYPLADGLKGHKIRFTIPAGSFIPNSDNEWKATLSNTLFDQAEAKIFVVDSLEKIPGKTSISFDKNQYKQWETVKLTLTASPNAQGTNDIKDFRVWVTYDSFTSTSYALPTVSVPAVKSGSRYTATVSFQVSRGDRNLYATAVAIDSEGRAGPEGEKQAYIEQVIPDPSPGGAGEIVDVIKNNAGYVAVIVIILLLVGGIGFYIYQKKSGRKILKSKGRRKR